MNLFSFIVTLTLVLFSTGVMSFISMATPIGPWIQPTVVLISIMIFSIFYRNNHHNIALTVIGSSIGGILATALGFSFPTLYFLDAPFFNNLMQSPIEFSLTICFLALSAGLLGYFIAELFEHRFIVEQQLAFPIGQLVHTMLIAQNKFTQALYLAVGFVTTFIFCILQDGIWKIKSFIPKIINVIPAIKLGIIGIPAIQLEMFPIYWAIGYITGSLITVPLILGACSKIFIVDVINNLFFKDLSSVSFVLAFCSGMVLCGALVGITDLPKLVKNFIREFKNKNNSESATNKNSMFEKISVFMVAIILLNIAFFTYFKFSPLLQIYIILFSSICAFQIASIAGKIGLAQLGRFATFVMVPAMFLFELSFLQLTMIATFVEICGGVTADLLFGRKVAHLGGICSKRVKKYQLVGIVFSSIAAGIIFWILINHFSLGSNTLFVQRSQARALLINAINFNYYVLLLGFVFGYILKKIKVNPMLVLGGLLMPFNISLGLIIGSGFNLVLKNKENWEPFWSGVFASNSIWVLIKALI
ncbi:MAG: OPT/YSL family transporter [Candidatus Babeliales bacterium]|nr:OPT/YSL family transporter [Candidatus Babeliales bacterium]